MTDWIAFTGAAGDTDAASAFEAQVDAWRSDPFDPHLLARMRPGTYQRSLVMKYLDTLIAWGDQLFTRDTLETVNEAIQLYVFAKQVLGERPAELPAAERPEPRTWNDLQADIDAFGNPLLALENSGAVATSGGVGATGAAASAGLVLSPYFCVPFNRRLLSYWDTLDDRLFKIRNGMNIAGVVRSLPLFQPELDPAALVRAAAAGVDIGAALSDTASVGSYRFSTMLGRAQSLAASVAGLGQALLSALEKRDAEALALLRQEHEGALLDAIEHVRELQVEEAGEALGGLRENLRSAEARLAYYERLLDQGWLQVETDANAKILDAKGLSRAATTVQGIAAVLSMFPEIAIGLGAHVKAGTGTHFFNAFSSTAGTLSGGAGIASMEAGRLTTVASYGRRKAEWKHQVKLAKQEIAALGRQIEAAKLRVEIAKAERENHALQIAHSAQVREWMERKYTRQELYAWMVTQLSTLHFQTWQLAWATARKAEACFRHELGRDDTWIQPVHWDGTRKGLLAGERLRLDLERMDQAYLDLDQRELELTRHVSLARLDPIALAQLRTGGECWFEVPEALFDLDCPGHWFRRLTSVALTAACVTGAQGQVNLRLTLHESTLRVRADLDAVEASVHAYPSVVTSTARQDSGLFDPSRSQPRYLPFERLGAASRWHLAFANPDHRQLDWNSVTDVVLHLQYTARDGGETFRDAVLAALPDALAGLRGGFATVDGTVAASERVVVGLSARRDDPDAWYAAQQAASGSLTLSVGVDRLPWFAVGRDPRVARVHVLTQGTALTGGEVALPDPVPLAGVTAWPPSSDAGLWLGTAEIDAAWPETVAITLTGVDLSQATDVLLVLELEEG
ncbi:MAG: hypothetical protein H6738_02860 [Alphaproteobacteria bacterium]|nr:hypothetical protein [Alphaproteobacteria bacterium]MCB9695711.1 hypothetical protein [Alphaproteobacteria bacterium]